MSPGRIVLVIGLVVGLSGYLGSAGPGAFGQDDSGRLADQKRQELIEREARLKKEEERLKNIEKEVDAKIQKVNKLLIQVDEGLKKVDDFRSERLAHLVKTFEAMPPEEAATRLVGLEKSLAIQIIFKMNTKKAGAVLGLMEPKKVAEFTEGLSKTEKKIPTK
jgi:flagellar motility protein MotE (MotC chaperone)